MKPVTRPKVTKEGDWVNPLKRLAGVPRPFLAGEAWAREPQSEAAAESRELLIRFYCSHREGNGSCEERLKAYFSSPDEDVFVIWGDVGIGKTWFIRYAMEVDPFFHKAHELLGGVIDMLHGGVGGVVASAYRQLMSDN